jgi:hypothetical protein
VLAKKGYTTVQVVSYWLLTMVAQVHTQVSPVGYVIDKVALGKIFPKVLWFSLQYHSTAAPYSLMFHLVMDNGLISGRSSTETVSPHHNNNNVNTLLLLLLLQNIY